MKYIIIIIVSFIFIFGPVFNKVGPWADSILLISVFLITYNLLRPQVFFPKYLSAFIILIPLFLYLSISVTLYNKLLLPGFIQVIFKPIRIFITLLGGYFIFNLIQSNYQEEYTRKVREIIFYCILINAIIMILQFQYPDFKDWIYSYTTTGEFRSSFEYSFRMGAFSGGTGGSVLSVVQSIGVLILPFLLKNASKYKKIVFITGAILIFLSILVCGRSGIWSVIIFFPFSLILSGDSIKTISIFKNIAILFCIILIFSGLISLIGYLETDNPIFNALSRSLDTFISFSDTGKFDDNTVDALQNHVIWPNDLFTLAFGKGEHIVNDQFDRTLNSDIGYIRDLWGFGVIGTIVYLMPVFTIVFQSFKNKKNIISAGLLILISIITIFFHMKEQFMYVRMLFSIYCLLVANYFFEKNQNKILLTKINASNK